MHQIDFSSYKWPFLSGEAGVFHVSESCRTHLSREVVYPFVNVEHRHHGEGRAILAARHALYATARELNPARWSGKTRNWSPIGTVTLNPERDCVVKAHSEGNDIRRWLHD